MKRVLILFLISSFLVLNVVACSSKDFIEDTGQDYWIKKKDNLQEFVEEDFPKIIDKDYDINGLDLMEFFKIDLDGYGSLPYYVEGYEIPPLTGTTSNGKRLSVYPNTYFQYVVGEYFRQWKNGQKDGSVALAYLMYKAIDNRWDYSKDYGNDVLLSMFIYSLNIDKGFPAQDSHKQLDYMLEHPEKYYEVPLTEEFALYDIVFYKRNKTMDIAFVSSTEKLKNNLFILKTDASFGAVREDVIDTQEIVVIRVINEVTKDVEEGSDKTGNTESE